MNELGIVLIGAAVGSLVTLVWEASLAPREAARSLAEVLGTDLSLHMQSLVAEISQRKQEPKTVPHRRPIPLGVFQAVAGRVGELPRNLIGHTVHLYRLFERLNEIAERANLLFDRLKETDEKTAFYATLLDDFHSELALYARFSENTLAKIQMVQPLMIGAASPGWSPRFWFAPKPQILRTEEITQKAAELRADRDRRKMELDR